MFKNFLKIFFLAFCAIFLLSSPAHAKKDHRGKDKDIKKHHSQDGKKDDFDEDDDDDKNEWDFKPHTFFEHHKNNKPFCKINNKPFCKIPKERPCGPVVTPEPLSSALFLFGGIPLAGRLIRKNRKSAEFRPGNNQQTENV